MSERLRVAYVTAGFPFPLSSGYLRHHHLLRVLSRRHEVRLRSLVGPRFDPADRDGLAGDLADVAAFGDGPVGRPVRALHRLAPSRRPAVGRLCARIARDVDDGVDAVVLSGKETASVLDVVPDDLPLVVDLCDATSARVDQELGWAGPARRPGLRLRRRQLRRTEAALVARADVLLTASARDRDLLREQGAPGRVDEAWVVPNGIDAAEWDRRSSELGGAVAFCGNLGYRPNADAARHLVGAVMPHVWSRRPETRVLIIGTGASPALVDALTHPQVTLTGPVDDVRPHLEEACVVAAPLRAATGIQNKLLEALALQVPVVTTTVAAAGLGAGAPLVVEDDPRRAGAAVLERVEAAAHGDRTPRAEARAWVVARFCWERSGRLLDEALGAAVGREAAAW